MHFNKSQRFGVYLLLSLIVFLQIAITFSNKLVFDRQKSEKPEIINFLQSKLDSLSRLKKVEDVNYFRFNPNNLDYKYWKYFGLSDYQLFLLDSFRVNQKFEDKQQLWAVLKLDSSQICRFDTLIWFNYSQPDSTLVKMRNYKSNTSKLRVFDPNKADLNTWIEMGFTQRQADYIIGQIARLNGIRKTSDLKNLKVFDSVKYEIFKSYVAIDSIYLDSKFPKELDINLASEIDLINTQCVGKNLAEAIIEYRQRLGGFCFEFQFSEVRNLDSVKFACLQKRFFISKGFVPRHIDINTAPFETLKNHPYVGYGLADKIVSFRERFRSFNSIEELANIGEINGQHFNKIKLYLEAKKKAF